ncbi:putative epoxide hydrolase [Sclerotinia borealis F-4128]|uniref:Putative epoxide hydrolase n=1 Tax=Sclerotinia borealis (strain F-4128) TaxID=1432307 RepID=W9CLX2_SCLBF|nr:putative epoxide hydrolase [Sclerotinia borealis F-4128]
MALTHLAVPGKILELEDGIKYAYIHIAAAPSKPTFLLLHGFPSSSYDWRYQIPYLKERGYGVIVPDLLGYGDTDKPTELERYKKKKMAGDLMQILDHEGLGTVIGASNLQSSQAHGVKLTGVHTDAANAMSEQAFGYPTFGYWKFFNEDDAHEIMGRNMESTTSLIFPSDPSTWKTHLGPLGAAKAWITSNTISPLPTWLSKSEAATHNEIFQKGGFAGPLNWYKATVRDFNVEDDANIPEKHIVQNAPALIIVSDEDYITRAEIAYQTASKWLRNFEIKKFEGCGHWIPLEKRDELSEALIRFADGI